MLLDTRITQKQEKGEGEWREKGCETGQEEKGTPSTISSTGSGYTQSVESVIVPDGEVCNTITLCTTLCPYKVSSCPHRGCMHLTAGRYKLCCAILGNRLARSSQEY